MFSDIASTELCELVIISRGSVRLGLAHKEALLQVEQLPGIGATHLLQMHRCFPLPRPPNLKHNCRFDTDLKIILVHPILKILRFQVNCKTLPSNLPEADCSIFTLSVVGRSSSRFVTINSTSIKPSI